MIWERLVLYEEDFFENLILYCLETDNSKTGSFHNVALQIVETQLHKQRWETEKLYNPYRNLCLDKSYGGSQTPLGERMNFFPDEED